MRHWARSSIVTVMLHQLSMAPSLGSGSPKHEPARALTTAGGRVLSRPRRTAFETVSETVSKKTCALLSGRARATTARRALT